MNIVTDNLDQIINAPDGIKRLRELILLLAVQGKLVEQRTEEGTAANLLKQIEEAKRKDAEERKARGERIRKQKLLPPIDEDEVLFDIPKDWKWVRLDDVYDVRDGTHDSPKYQPTGYPLVTSKNLSSGKLDISNVKFISKSDHEKICDRSRVDLDDILFAMIGSIGNPAIVDIEPEFSIKNVALFKYYSRVVVEPQYLLIHLEHAAEHMRATADGGVQSFVSLSKLRAYPHPLPPLLEQKRIVAKVDELMAWCDELEALKEKRTDLQKAALKASLNLWVGKAVPAVRTHAETAPPNGALGEHSLPLTNLFTDLIREPADVKQLRDAILQLAVQGRLVPQHESDGTATDLLQQIEIAKATDLKCRKAAGERIRKTKVLPPIKEEEIPFDIPENWEWVKLGNVARYGESKKVSPNNIVEDTWVLELEDIEKNTSRILGRHTFGQRKSKSSKAEFKQGDVLYGKLRPYLNKAIVADAHGVCTTEIVAIEQFAGIEPYFMLATLKSPYFIGHVNELTYGIKMPRLGTTDAKNTAIPLPPFAEQQRIVKKVDELMAWCDELETLLQAESTTATQFAAAIAQQGGI